HVDEPFPHCRRHYRWYSCKGQDSFPTMRTNLKEVVAVKGPIKRKWEFPTTISKLALSFGDDDLVNETPNNNISLLIRVIIANYDVHKVLVDQVVCVT
ncbi:hypothetical protein L195_g029065, partial [Trifolium pratense]